MTRAPTLSRSSCPAELDAIVAAQKRGKEFPTVAELADKVDTRGYRRGTGKLFMHDRNIQNPDPGNTSKVRRLQPMPEKPTLIDFFKLRFPPAAHLLQSARLARKNGLSEEIILACLLHDTGQYLCYADHGYWGAQIVEPYVSERVAFAIRYHQALRFYPDHSVGYSYPEGYLLMFGTDYVPLPHVQAAYTYARNHKWYMDARMVTTNDLYSLRPQCPGRDRRVHRRDRAPLQAAEGRPRQRQYAGEPYVAEHGDPGRAVVRQGALRTTIFQDSADVVD